MADANPEGQGEEKFSVSTWLPECYVDSEPAVCELNPCGHFISIDTARHFAARIRRGEHAANPDRCPMCRTPWTEIRCLSVEASINKIIKNLDDYTINIPDGPLRTWFKQILHFFTSENNALESELQSDIGKCLVDSFIKRGRTGNTLAITNNSKKIIALIECVDKAVNGWIDSNFGSDRKKAIAAQKEGVLGEVYEDSPIQWLLEISDRLNTAAIEQARTVRFPVNNTVIPVGSIINGLHEGIAGGARRVAQVPGRVATAALATAVLIGTSKMYGDIDRSTCAELSTAQERAPDVPIRGRWEDIKVCENTGTFRKFEPEFCCDPKLGRVCGTDKYHPKGGEGNKYSGPEVAFRHQWAFEPGRYHDCDTSTSASCLGITGAAWLAGTSTIGHTSWEKSKGAKFVTTAHAPGPLLPSEQEQCHTTLSLQEMGNLVGAAVSVGVLIYGLYRACTESRPPAPDLVGDDTLVITPDGREHRGGSKYSIKRRRRRKNTRRKRGGDPDAAKKIQKIVRGRQSRKKTVQRLSQNPFQTGAVDALVPGMYRDGFTPFFERPGEHINREFNISPTSKTPLARDVEEFKKKRKVKERANERLWVINYLTNIDGKGADSKFSRDSLTKSTRPELILRERSDDDYINDNRRAQLARINASRFANGGKRRKKSRRKKSRRKKSRRRRQRKKRTRRR